jgi:hypothetical protein
MQIVLQETRRSRAANTRTYDAILLQSAFRTEEVTNAIKFGSMINYTGRSCWISISGSIFGDLWKANLISWRIQSVASWNWARLPEANEFQLAYRARFN